jgi:hypothetical protein
MSIAIFIGIDLVEHDTQMRKVHYIRCSWRWGQKVIKPFEDFQ